MVELVAQVLFVSSSNTASKRMSAALLERAAEGRHQSVSAGTTTAAPPLRPEVVEVMREVGIDLSARPPRKLTEPAARWANVAVTMGCDDARLHLRRSRHIEWELPDSQGKPLEEVRAVRDEIDRRVRELLPNLG